MRTPRGEIALFVEQRFPGATVEPLAGDGSARCFYRIRLPSGEGTVVLLDYGSAFEAETDDTRLNALFQRAGLPVARLIEAAPTPGCLVLEDLGDETLESSLVDAERASDRSRPPALLVRAVELAAEVAKSGTPVLARSERVTGPALDADRFRFEMDFFVEHYVRGLRGRSSVSPELCRRLHDLAVRAAETPRRVMCHRDFHSRNLMVRADGGLVMVDIQDARWGPDSYDLASILRDAYLPTIDGWVDPLIEHYVGALGGTATGGGFRERFHRVAAQRMIKALGSFGYLSRAGRGRGYLDAIPTTLARLRRSLPASADTIDLFSSLSREELLTD